MAHDISKRRKFEYSSVVNNPIDEWLPNVFLRKLNNPVVSSIQSNTTHSKQTEITTTLPKKIQVDKIDDVTVGNIFLGTIIDRSIILYFQYFFINMLINLLNARTGKNANQDLIITVSCLGVFGLAEKYYGRCILLYILLFLFCFIKILHSIVSKNK